MVSQSSQEAERRRFLRLVSYVLLAAAVVTPVIVSIVVDLPTGANLAQVFSLPATLVATSGVLASGAAAPPRPPQAPSIYRAGESWRRARRPAARVLSAGLLAAALVTVGVKGFPFVAAAFTDRPATPTPTPTGLVDTSGPPLDLSDAQWKAVEEQLSLAKETLSMASECASNVEVGHGDLDMSESASQRIVPLAAEGGVLRMFHALLKKQDMSYADLRRVRDAQGRYLWIHPRFVPVYQPPLPDIPVATHGLLNLSDPGDRERSDRG
jgi:hypothetical protein